MPIFYFLKSEKTRALYNFAITSVEKIDQWFDTVRQAQYTKEILFSSIVSLMLQVVCKVRTSVHVAYLHSDINASVVAVYDKLKGVETQTSQELVRYMASESESIISHLNGANPPLWPGYRVKFLDGNCIKSTEHRLNVLRETAAGPLPGKSLVVFVKWTSLSRQCLVEFKVEPLRLWVTESMTCRHIPRPGFGSPRTDGAVGGCRSQNTGTARDRRHPTCHSRWDTPLRT